MPRKRRKYVFGSWSTTSRFSKPVNMPDIGTMVRSEMYTRHITVPGLARMLSVSADRVYRLMARKDWRVSELMNVSTLLGVNLFAWYTEQTQPEVPDSAAHSEDSPASTTGTAEQQQRIAVLEAENKLLREMVELLKKQ